MKAVILAAGYATRLYPLTLNIPKPLLKITASKAVIDFIVDDLESSGRVEEIVVVTNHKFYSVFAAWARRRQRGACHRVQGRPVAVLDDGTISNEDRLGAVGDMAFAVARKKITSDFVVVGGDNLFDKGFGKFLEFADRHTPYASLGLFDIGDKKIASRFGVVSTAKDNRVVSFEEKPLRPATTCVATCLYFFPCQTLPLLERYSHDKTVRKDAPGHYIRWLMEHDRVYGFAMKKGHWHDIGHFDSYKDVVAQFNGALKD